MADVVETVVKAPKKAFSFAENNLLAFALLALVLVVLLVAYETRKPGQLRDKVSKIPGVGKWATTAGAFLVLALSLIPLLA